MKKHYNVVKNPKHPNSHKNGFMYEHVLVASEKLGRPLFKGECVHHLDENIFNNKPENLIVFKTRSDHSRFHKGGSLIKNADGTFSCLTETSTCSLCGHEKLKKSLMCKKCAHKEKSKNIPEKEYLEKLIWSMPSTHVANIFNVSSKAVEKWCKKYGIEKPPRGYWQKLHNGKSYADISIGG